jgi:hypothetical protein
MKVELLRKLRPVDCPHCFKQNVPCTHLCIYCNTPLSAYAATAPLGQVYSEFNTYQKAIECPNKPIILIGMWLLWGPTSSFFIWTFILFTRPSFKTTNADDPVGDWIAWLFGLAILCAVALVPFTILFRTTHNFIKLRKAALDAPDTESDDTPVNEEQAPSPHKSP